MSELGRSSVALLGALLVLASCAAEQCVDEPLPAPAPSSPSPPSQVAPRRARVDPGPTERTRSVRREVAPAIGLVASDDPVVTAALAVGARRALAEARDGEGPSLDLLVGERESHWASAAAAAVRMAMDDGAVAVIAPPERRRAHEIAQFGTRAGVPVISTSPAASVTQAGSTWVVSVVEGGAQARSADTWESAGYDAARAVIEAVRRNGLRREGLTSSLAGRASFEGAHGPIAISERGARQSR